MSAPDIQQAPPGRSHLGEADLSDADLLTLVSRQLGLAGTDVELLEASAEVVPYDLEALTTAGRWWVRGLVRAAGSPRPFSFFVKAVQSWSRSPLFAFVPEEHREIALAGLP